MRRVDFCCCFHNRAFMYLLISGLAYVFYDATRQFIKNPLPALGVISVCTAVGLAASAAVLRQITRDEEREMAQRFSQFQLAHLEAIVMSLPPPVDSNNNTTSHRLGGPCENE